MNPYKENVFLGFRTEALFLNLLFIIAKNYIYKCKLNEVKPNIIGLKNKIKMYESYDFYVAKKNSTEQAFQKFWSPLQQIFT